MKTLRYLFFVCASTVLVACSQTAAEETATWSKSQVEVTVESGDLKGQVDKDNDVVEWLGVPYAESPVGELRWKAPQDVEAWDDVYDATEYGDMAIQLSNGEVTGSEDALNLDVVRPNTDDTDLPVIVYVHGGNNQTSSAQEIKGNTLVNDIDAVYVSVNYRLGALGFNPLEALKNGTDEENSGNYSLLDIAKALDWVRANIEAFGGDAENVTLAGFSAGGRDVMATLISPLFEGKYDKAISFSGGMTLADEAESQDIFAEALAPLVVEDKVKETEEEAKEWLLSTDQEVTDYLYELEAERLAELMGNASIRMAVFPHLYTDGVVIPEEGFETATYNNVPLMMVTGTDEFSLFAAFDKRFAEDFSSGDLFKDEDKLNEFLYAKNYGSQLYRLFNGVEGANIMANSYDASIYITEIAYGANEDVTPTLAASLGAFHGIFEPMLQSPSNYEAFIGKDFENDGAAALTAEFRGYLKNFLATGDPNGDDLVTWDAWDASTNAILSMDADKKASLTEMSTDTETAQDILDKMAADDSIDDKTKETLNKEVLNGRWFSSLIDQANAELETE